MKNKQLTDLLTAIGAGGILAVHYLLVLGVLAAEEAVKAWGMRLILAFLIAVR